MTALYVHLPFCARKCAYCDFASWAERLSDAPSYLAALESEMADRARQYGRLRLHSIFLGGGTPSLLPSDAVMHIVAMARARFDVAPDAEITVECNPGTVTPGKLRDYAGAGVNRLSFGMQAKSPRLLALLGRIHTHEETQRAVSLAREAGFRNLNLDLIYALPTQTMAEWIDSVQAALALDVPHLSLYNLILEAGTPLACRVAKGELSEADEALSLRMRAAAGRMLARRGFTRYEISNYAKPGYVCRHNLGYWRRTDYLGLGCAAHSLLRGERFQNTAVLDEYLRGVRETDRQALTADDIFEEKVLLGTRTAEGIPLELLRDRMNRVDSLRALGLVETGCGRLWLTERGLDVQNRVVLTLVQ